VGSIEVWLQGNWFNVVQTVSIVFALVFTGLSLRRDTRSRRLSNLLILKGEHRELWSIIHGKPEFARILQADVDLVGRPMKSDEEIFLRQMIAHFAAAFELIQDGTPLDLEAFRRDAKEIFSLPLPKSAWQRAKNLQNPGFSKFIEDALIDAASQRPKAG
jgi:hypothetical protein